MEYIDTSWGSGGIINYIWEFFAENSRISIKQGGNSYNEF